MTRDRLNFKVSPNNKSKVFEAVTETKSQPRKEFKVTVGSWSITNS